MFVCLFVCCDECFVALSFPVVTWVTKRYVLQVLPPWDRLHGVVVVEVGTECGREEGKERKGDKE
jgi:hypothetical protein